MPDSIVTVCFTDPIRSGDGVFSGKIEHHHRRVRHAVDVTFAPAARFELQPTSVAATCGNSMYCETSAALIVTGIDRSAFAGAGHRVRPDGKHERQGRHAARLSINSGLRPLLVAMTSVPVAIARPGRDIADTYFQPRRPL
jgi:hypothetical protein